TTDIYTLSLHDALPILLIEDIDKEISLTANENTLFHLYNLVQERGGSLLLTARSAPAAWDVDLADLRSRLGTIAVAHIREPDDRSEEHTSELQSRENLV